LSKLAENSGEFASVPDGLEPNRSVHGQLIEPLHQVAELFLAPKHSKEKEKLSPIMKTSISLPALGGMDGSVESLNALTPLSNSKPKLQAQFVTFVANGVKPGTMVEGGSVFVAGWKVRNNGTIDWPSNLVVTHVHGDQISLIERSERKTGWFERDNEFKNMIVPALKVQEEGEITGMFVAPRVTRPTLMQCFWRIAQGDDCFGQRLKLEVDVIPPTMTLLERQYRKIEQLGFTDRKLIEQAMHEADRDIERAVVIILKRQSSSQ